MSPNLIGLVSAAVYGLIVIYVQQVAVRFGVVASMLCYLPVAWFAMLCIYQYQRYTNSASPLPSTGEFKTLLILGLLFALGQGLNAFAYSLGAQPVIMSCITLTMPMFVSVYLLFFFKGDLPNLQQACGYAVIVAGVMILLWGNIIEKAAAK